MEDSLTGPRMTGEVTWRTEFYFLAACVASPRYVMSVAKPHVLFGNDTMHSLWRMIEQATHRRSKNDPLIECLSKWELEETAEYKRSDIPLDSLWDQLSDASIKTSPEKIHRLLEYYAAARIIDSRITRRLRQLASGDLSPQDAVVKMQSDIVGVTATGSYQSSTVRKIMQDLWESRNGTPAANLRTGFPKMDDVIGSLVPGCTYLFCARTSHGKSSWAAQIVNQQAMDGHMVGVIGMEDSKSIWASRWMSRVSGVSLKKIRDNVLSHPGEDDPLDDVEESAIEEATLATHLDNVHLADAKGARLVDVLRTMNDMVVRHGCQIIWLDYLQAIYAESGDSRSRRDFLEYCWAMLEREAERLEIPLMITAQLNRQWEQEPLPTMPGLRHTEWMGAAEQKAYVGVVIYRPHRDPRIGQRQRDERFGELVVNIEKCKQGESVAIKYEFDPAACVIREV
jgi:replicative DNA helicase